MVGHLPPGVLSADTLPSRARLATWPERTKDSLIKVPQAVGTAVCSLNHGHAKDHMLARLDDTTRLLGVTGIAGLGSLGVHQPGASLPLWLGGASWLGAMAITPKILNGAVYLKTGVNLNTKYLSSGGDIRPLFQDPNYMPLQVLPLQKRIELADRLNIPQNRSDRLTLLQDKLKQIAVQTHTWWMLIAGMTTPVLAALICDRLEDAAKEMVSQIRSHRAYQQKLLPALNSKNPQQITKALEATVEAAIGSGSEVTTLSRWWKQFPPSVLKTLRLDTLPQSRLIHANSEARFDRVVRHLEGQLRSPQTKDALKAFVQQQQFKLDRILAPLEKLFEDPQIKATVPQSTQLKLAQELQLARDTAEGTMRHLHQLSEVSLKGVPRQKALALLKEKMEKSVLSEIEQLNRTGEITKAIKLAGGSTQFNRIVGSFNEGRFAKAFAQIGDSPKSLILKALESLTLRRRWVKRFPGIVGGGVLIATAFFALFVLGKDFGGPSGDRRTS